VRKTSNSEAGPDLGFRFASRLSQGRAAAWFEAGLDVAALLFFPLLVLVPRGIAALISVAGISAAGLLVSAGRTRLSATFGLTAVLLVCLVLWGAASASWSINPTRSLTMAARLTGLFVAGLALAAAAHALAAPRRLTFTLIVGLALALGVAAIDLATAGSISSLFSDRVYRTSWLNQASISFAILLFPTSATLFLLGLTKAAAIIAAATAASVFALAGTAAKAVLMAGLAIGVLLHRSRSRGLRVAAVVSVIVIVTTPLTFGRLDRIPGLGEKADTVKTSAGHRLLIWSFAGDRIAERALTGWGLDASRTIPGGSDLIRPTETWLPLHPHNAALQVWLELGVPGAVMFALLLAVAWTALANARWPPLFAAAAGAALTTSLVGCFATYGIWQEWWLGTLSFSLFIILVMARVISAASGAERKPADA
jgi:O-antigen ligase